MGRERGRESSIRRLLYVFSGFGGAEFSKKIESSTHTNEHDDGLAGTRENRPNPMMKFEGMIERQMIASYIFVIRGFGGFLIPRWYPNLGRQGPRCRTEPNE